MDKDLARIVAVAAWRSSRELGDLIPLLKEHCTDDVYAVLGHGIANTLSEISLQILKPIFAIHPELELEKEFERNLVRHGRTS